MKVYVLSVSLLLLAACGNEHMPVSDSSSKGGTSPTALDATGAPGQADVVSFNKDIKPIFKKTCEACHGEGSGIGNWMDYASAYAKRDVIKQRVVSDKNMPKAPFDAMMTDADRALIAKWVSTGAAKDSPKGSGSKPGSTANSDPAPAAPRTPTPPPAPLPEPPAVQGGYTYLKDIQPIFKAACATCHGEGGMFGNWLDYNSAFAKKDAINKRVVIERTMPSVPFDANITNEQRAMIGKWIRDGAPKGTAGGAGTPVVTPVTPDAPPPVATGCKTGLNTDLSNAILADAGKKVEQLLSQGACVNGKDAAGKTMLMFAIEKSAVASIEVLVKSGADIHAQNTAGADVLSFVNQLADAKVRAQVADLVYAAFDEKTGKAFFLTFVRVKVLFKNKCSTCHATSPSNFKVYQDIFDKKDTILTFVTNGIMPKDNMTKMTDAERTLIGKWIKSGAVEK